MAGQMGAIEAYKYWQYAAGLHGSHRGGLWSVPFDAYRAELHHGETVLPAVEATRYRTLSRIYMHNQLMSAVSSGRLAGDIDRLVSRLDASMQGLRQEVSRLCEERIQGDRMNAEATAVAAQANAREVVEGVTEAVRREEWQQSNRLRFGTPT